MPPVWYSVMRVVTLVPLQARLAKNGFFFGHLFFQYKQTSFAPKNGWGMLVYAPGWSLANQFWSYIPPQKLVFPFPAAKKMKIPH